MNPSKRFFSLSMFRKHDLPNLSINIWEYSDCRHGDCFICKFKRSQFLVLFANNIENGVLQQPKKSGVIFIMILIKL